MGSDPYENAGTKPATYKRNEDKNHEKMWIRIKDHNFFYIIILTF